MAARFELRQHAGPGRSARPELIWRMLSNNNRDLGRSMFRFADAETCLSSVMALKNSLLVTVPVVYRVSQTSWSWRLDLAADVMAVASRVYQRRVEAEAACELFVELAEVAEVADSVRYGRW